jgi:hypothetical protein
MRLAGDLAKLDYARAVEKPVEIENVRTSL